MDDNKAYIYENLYLPKKHFRLAGIAKSLEIPLPKLKKTDETKVLKLWDIVGNHIKVPRHYISKENMAKYNFEFVNNRPEVFPHINIKSKITLRNLNQARAFQALQDNRDGILNLNTGKGKTILALHKIALSEQPALIVVHNSFLQKQWIKRIEEHLDFEGDIGIIEGPKMKWQQPIVVAMIQTLANRAIANELPIGFREWFGSVFYDETHHLGAPVFSKSADVCLGSRYGLSATPQRADGLDAIVRYHLGDIFYSDMSYDLLPEIFFIETPVNFNVTEWDTIFKLLTRVTKNKDSIEFRYKWIKQAYDEGRKIIVVSNRLDQLEALGRRFENPGYIIGETPFEQRLEIVKKSRIIFAISRMGLEGLDDDNIDTIFFASPIGGDVTVTENGRTFLGNQVRQGFGRILRDNGKGKRPQAFFFDDVNIEMMSDITGQVKAFLRSEGFNFKVIRG